jgi:regulator of protease activity HflC (stomatin/prohibitin superfamily)
VVLLVVGLPLLGLFLFLLLQSSWVQIESGKLGLLTIRGRATDTSLPPGRHWVPALRRRAIVEYPSRELSYRAGEPAWVADPYGSADATERSARSREDDAAEAEPDLERSGPALPVALGDRAEARVHYTVRFRLDTDQLRSVHERFGPYGLWGVVRDTSARTLALALNGPDRTVEDVVGPRRTELNQALESALREALAVDGFVLTLFHLSRIDLGRSGEAIQAVVRAKYELDRERAEAETRRLRAHNDAELAAALGDVRLDSVLAYREAELWREVAQRDTNVSVVLPAPTGTAPRTTPLTTQPSPDGGAAAGDAEAAVPPPAGDST